MKAALFLVAAGLLALVACAVNVPEPTPLDAGGSESTLSDLRAGRTLYVNKCSGCHSLFSVERFSDGEWRMHVREMVDEKKKVKLEAGERERLELYLTRLNARD